MRRPVVAALVLMAVAYLAVVAALVSMPDPTSGRVVSTDADGNVTD